MAGAKPKTAARGRKSELLELSLNEVSFVDEPANPGARLMLWKRREHDGETRYAGLVSALSAIVKDFNGELAENELREQLGDGMSELWEAYDALCSANSDVMWSDEVADKGAAIAENFRQFRDALGPLLDALAAGQPVPEDGETEPTGKSRGEERMKTVEQLQRELDEKTAQLGTAQKALETATGQVETLTAEVAKLKGQAETEEQAIEKLKDSNPALYAMVKRARETEKQLAALTVEREVDAIEKRLGTIAKNLSVEPGKFAVTLHRIATGKSNAEDLAELERILAAANEAVGKSLFDQVGKSGNGGSNAAPASTGGGLTGSSAAEQIETLAQEKRKADPALTIEKARTRVMAERPDLYDAHRQEELAKRRAAA